jgi:UDP-N-acetylmuramoylalanine--D-glutamate ligase
LLREALEGAVDVREAASLDSAIEQAYALAKPAGVVLLAPACASFDQFRDYEERGETFRRLVGELW